MPYISTERRKDFDEWLEHVEPDNSGELNYCITKLTHNLLQRNSFCYSIINGVIGVLECAKLELYRMIVAKHEDKKRRENGPISDLDSRTLEDVR